MHAQCCKKSQALCNHAVIVCRTWGERSWKHGVREPDWCHLVNFPTICILLWPPDVKSQLIGIDPNAGKDWGQEKKGTTEDEIVGWHHWLNGCEFKQTLGDSEGQRSLVCYSPWGCRVGLDLATKQQQIIFPNYFPVYVMTEYWAEFSDQ